MDHAVLIQEELALPNSSAVRILEVTIAHANALRASDIHIDPAESVLMVRFRIEGALRDMYAIPKQMQDELLARLKILANLRIDEHQMPQDGRFRLRIEDEVWLDMRVSIAPTFHGENAVLRLLSSQAAVTSLETLGLSDFQQRIIHRALTRPNGLLLITGPTGSGKTSTLYALLHALNSRESSIITIEDPIEYSIDGITQMHARRSGFTFAEGLRSVLRQDPNIIGIGEIRDSETASLAIHAALTGHLVLSTLHTTSAVSAIPRLMDMGSEPYLIASTLQVVINQRLMRRQCEVCVVREPLRDDQLAALQEILAPAVALPAAYAVAHGCNACSRTGTNGRIGVFEVLPISNEMRDACMRKSSAAELAHIARDQGMRTVLEQGLQMVAAGIVSLDEVIALAYE